MSKQTGIVRKAADISKDATVGIADPSFPIPPPAETIPKGVESGKKTKPVCKRCWFTGQFVNDRSTWLCKDNDNNDVIHAPAPTDMTAKFQGTHATNYEWFSDVIGAMKLHDGKKVTREFKPNFTTVQELTDNGIISVWHCKMCPVRKCKVLPGFTCKGIRAWYHVPLDMEIMTINDLGEPSRIRKEYEDKRDMVVIKQQERETARAAGVQHIEQLSQQASADTDDETDDAMDLDDTQEFPDLVTPEPAKLALPDNEKDVTNSVVEPNKARFVETQATATVSTTKKSKHWRKKSKGHIQESSGSGTLQEWSLKESSTDEKKVVSATDLKATATEIKLKMPADVIEMMELTKAIQTIEKYATGKLIWNTVSPATVPVKIVNPILEKKATPLAGGYKQGQSWADE